MTEKRRAIFMDRDGTVSHEVGYINHISRLRPYSHTYEAVRLINQSNYLGILVTNQAGVARGYFVEDMVIQVHNLLQEKLKAQDAYLDDIYYCPHHPSTGEPPYRQACNCRKPRPGMLLAAAEKHNIDLSQSYMIGDKISDVEMAKQHGLKGVMVMTGYGRGEYEHQRDSWTVTPDYLAENLLEAVKWILNQ